MLVMDINSINDVSELLPGAETKVIQWTYFPFEILIPSSKT